MIRFSPTFRLAKHSRDAIRIVEEMAGQLDDLYQEAQRHGASSPEAERAAFAQIENSARIIEAEGPNRVSPQEQRREDARDRASAPRGGLFHRLFGNSAEFWLNAQRSVDLWDAEQKIRHDMRRIKPLRVA